jgi:AraC family transcriptional regulator, mar-sox-rob regulon activator
MDQAGIIRDLLVWLESHLDQPLSLDNVAIKAGYSKWHLQRMFKNITGHAIGAYIRARRLTKAAVALRLTGRPILDIALQYRFDSQQTFTRAFKKQFNQTPAGYRRAAEWVAFGIRPQIRMGEFFMPQPEIVEMPDLALLGHTQIYTCTLEQINSHRADMRRNFWAQFLNHMQTVPSEVYGLNKVCVSSEKEDEQEIFYTTAVTDNEQARQYLPSVKPILVPGGRYVKFRYSGPKAGFQEFILILYTTCMPTLNLTRRVGLDIERFFGQDCLQQPDIHCDYMIPIL